MVTSRNHSFGKSYPQELIRFMSEKKVDHHRRRFLVLAVGATGAVGALAAAVPFVSSWQPSEQAKAAGAPVEVDISKLLPGAMLTVEWRGKPVWIVHRDTAALDSLTQHPDLLRDPNSEVAEQQPNYAQNPHRSIKPEHLVLVGVCTHLGCSPLYKPHVGEVSADWPGGFFCPCHGSKFDLAGRVFKSVPAPINLEVPPYRYVNEHTLLIGADT